MNNNLVARIRRISVWDITVVSQLGSWPAVGLNMKTMRRILTGNLQRLAALQHLPRYQEYLALGDDLCQTLYFQYYYIINFGSQPKDLDEDILKHIVGGVKKDEHEVQVVGELDL